MTTLEINSANQSSLTAALVRAAATEDEKPIGKVLCHEDLHDVWIPSDDNSVYEFMDYNEGLEVEDLVLPEISGNHVWTTDGLADAFARQYGIDRLVYALYIFGENGGYTLKAADYWVSNYEVDHEAKTITLDDNITNTKAAAKLNEAIERELEGKEYFWDKAARVSIGSLKVIGGTATAVVGGVGIMTPEPTMATKVGGWALFALGASNVAEGFSQISGENQGQGYNPLGELAAYIGHSAGGVPGEKAARDGFFWANILISVGGAYKVLKIPNQRFFFKGTFGSGGRLTIGPGSGFTVGRLQFSYKMTEGRVWVNMTNNNNQWFLRFQTINGRLVMNGRIISVENWHRLSSPKDMCKTLLKLFWHGAKMGAGK